MKFELSQRSLHRMSGIDDRLVDVIREAIKITPYDFAVTEGLRSVTRQQQMVKEGKSRTMKSKHLTGHAFDICVYVNGKVTWENSYYEQVAGCILGVAAKLGVPLTWGGTFKDFRDDVHYEITKGFEDKDFQHKGNVK